MLEEGIDIVFETSMRSVETSSEVAKVSLDNGQTLMADFLVAADGYDSVLRSLVGTKADDEETPPQQHLYLTFLLPLEILNQYDELRHLVIPSNVSKSLYSSSELHPWVNLGDTMAGVGLFYGHEPYRE